MIFLAEWMKDLSQLNSRPMSRNISKPFNTTKLHWNIRVQAMSHCLINHSLFEFGYPSKLFLLNFNASHSFQIKRIVRNRSWA